MENSRRLKSIDHSFVAIVERFVQTVDQMDNTVLCPMKLIDLPVKDIMPASSTDSYLENNMNMRAFYFMAKGLRIKLSLTRNQSVQNEGHNVPLEKEIHDSTQRLNQLAFVARYLTTCSVNAGPNLELLTFSEFLAWKLVDDHCENSLLGAVNRFADEVEGMEKSVLFPCLLRDHNVCEQMPLFNDETRTLYDVFALLRNLRTELLSGSWNFELLDPKLQQKLSGLCQTFLRYTAMARNLTARYKEEVQCF